MARVGYRTEFLLTPTVVDADAIRDTRVESRRCLFHDEGEGEETSGIFRWYSQAGCFTECMLDHARETCHCVPWDVPFADGDGNNGNNFPICSSYGYYCFNEAMKNTTHRGVRCGGCLPDCNVVDYHVTTTSTPIDPETECGPGKVPQIIND